MLGAVYYGNHKLEIIEKELRPAGAGDVLIKIDSATICGTDLHIVDGNFNCKHGTVIGHEFSGYVMEKGEAVTACQTGDLVTVEPHKFCGVCKFCRVGKIQQCLNKQAYGVHLDGGFGQYVIVPQDVVYPVPAGITPEEAALVEPVGCTLHGIEQVGVNAGDTVLILGGGVIGILLTKMARLHGAAQVIVSEPVAHRRQKLLEHGATQVIDPSAEDVLERVMALTGGLGADVVIEAAGRAETAAAAPRYAGRAGRILFFGVVPPDKRIEVSPNEIYTKELKIIGSAINPFVHYRAIQLLKQLNVRDLVTHTFPLSQINEALEAARHSVGLKICVKPNQE
jgi:2-desacetyl-2-hydroxyethyl bacteriochlorophyllide A dehydrogenase